MAEALGLKAVGSTVGFLFTTHQADGANVAPSSAFEAADLRIYKDGSATQRSSANGITMTSPFDSLTGVHHVAIDLSDNTDSGFYASGSVYEVVLSPDETIDSAAVTQVIARFEIGETPSVQDVVDALLDELLSAHTTAGTVGKGISDIKAVTDVLPDAGALTSIAQASGVNVTQIAGGTTAADNLRRSAESIYYGTVDSGTTTTLVDSGLTEADTDHWNGRVVIFLTGGLAKQATDITAFDPSSDELTFTALTNAPSASDTYVIV